MAPEQTSPDSGGAATSEEVEAGTTEQATPDTDAPVLNRAQRRAQTKGKNSGVANPAVPHSQNVHGPGSRGSGPAGQPRFPRTGHK